jgi:hypothetical protein
MTRLKRHRVPRRQWVCHARALPGRTAEADPAQSATGQGWTAEKGQADSTKVV